MARRHAAITLWLNSGVTLNVAQTWSGHKALWVLLDTCLGVMQHVAHRRSNKRTTSDPTRGKPGTLMAHQKRVTRQDAD